MPIDESFAKELENAVEQSVVDAEPDHDTEVQNEDAGDKAADDVGAAAVGGKDGDSGATGADVDGAATTEKGSAGGGDSDSITVNTGTGKTDSSVSTTISDPVLTEAVRHGIPIEDARLFPNDSALNRAIGAIRKSIERITAKEETKVEEEEDLLAKLPSLDKEQYEPEVVSMFDAVIGVVKKQQEQLKELRQQTEQYNANSTRSQQMAAQREVTEWFDSQVAKLGDDFKDVLGVGGTDALKPDSQQKAKRDAIANQAAILFAGYNATGVSLTSKDDVFTQAARIVLADDFAKLAEKKLTANLQKRSKQHIQRAGGNQKQKSNGDPVEAVADELQKLFPHLSR
jgi:hypothetical protein